MTITRCWRISRRSWPADSTAPVSCCSTRRYQSRRRSKRCFWCGSPVTQRNGVIRSRTCPNNKCKVLPKPCVTGRHHLPTPLAPRRRHRAGERASVYALNQEGSSQIRAVWSWLAVARWIPCRAPPVQRPHGSDRRAPAPASPSSGASLGIHLARHSVRNSAMTCMQSRGSLLLLFGPRTPLENMEDVDERATFATSSDRCRRSL